MAIVLNGTTGITTPDLNTTAQSTDITTTGDITAVDATLSGGVYLGGTGSANYLNDYETGTFTVDIIRGGVASVSGNNGDGGLNGYYVKVGRMVHVTISTGNGWCYHASSTSGQSITISGSLPFVPVRAGGSQVAHSRTIANPDTVALGWRTNSAVIYLQTSHNGYPMENNAVSLNSQSNTSLIWSGSYYTDA